MFNFLESPKEKGSGCQTKLSNYLKKLDSSSKYTSKKQDTMQLNASGNISNRFGNQTLQSIENNSSVQYSTVELFTEENKNEYMFSLPIDECFDLINYEPKSSIDSLAQTVPSLTTKTKQIPKTTPSKTKENDKNKMSDKDLLSHKMPSYSSFKKKHSNQVQRGKLGNYINSKVSQQCIISLEH